MRGFDSSWWILESENRVELINDYAQYRGCNSRKWAFLPCMGCVWATNITKAICMGLFIQEDSSLKK